MRTRFLLYTMFCLIVALGMVSCTSSAGQAVPTASPTQETAELPTEPPTAVPEATVDPAAEVVMEYAARVNAGDYAGAAALFADDAIAYFVGMPPTGMEIYWGKAQYQTFLEGCCTGQNFEMEVTVERVADDVVYAEAKTWMDFTRELGVAPNSFHEVFVVRDGKIALYTSTLTEEALANFKPVLLEAIPELAQAMQPPAATNAAPATEVTVTIANGTCIYDGPMMLQAGTLTLNVDLQDENWGKYAVSFTTLDEGKDMVDLMAATYRPSPPSWARMFFLQELPDASQTWTYSLPVEEGLLYLVCWAGSPDSSIGNAGPFVVVPKAEAGGSEQAAPETAVDPAAAVVLEMVARANAEDYAGAAELVADDMMAYFIGMPPTGMEIYWGKGQFQTFLEECCTGQHFEWEVVPERVEDGVVYAESKTWMDFTRELGVAPNSWHEMFAVNDGKISLYVSTITEEALAKFKPVIFKAIPELALAGQLPDDTGVTPATSLNISIANGTCAYDGPMILQSGTVTVHVDGEDPRWEKYAISFFTLDVGKDMIDLMAATARPNPPLWSDLIYLRQLPEGTQTETFSLSLDEGPLYMICWAGSPDIAIGNAGPFVVKP